MKNYEGRYQPKRFHRTDFNPIRWTMAFPPDVDPAEIEWTKNENTNRAIDENVGDEHARHRQAA